MEIDYSRLRIEGVYKQDDAGRLMQRIKDPAGVLSAEQAEQVAEIADRFAGGRLHLTTRCSLELHGLLFADLPEVQRRLAAVGLVSRGACGGAVRGISCSTALSPGFSIVQVLAGKLQRHFTGNPYFEGLPKKFKVAVEADETGGRHLIQDAGLVLAGEESEEPCYDVWLAGGLGREPQPAFLYQRAVPEKRLVPLLEGVLRLYRKHAPPGRRLKHVVREKGENDFRRLLAEELSQGPAELVLADGFDKSLLPAPVGKDRQLLARVFAGEIETGTWRQLVKVARQHGGGFLVLTADQDVAFSLPVAADRETAAAALAEAGFSGATVAEQTPFRVCPGNHECRMGLAPTRDMAAAILERLGEKGKAQTWAISGCPNSCSQPQLASIGIVAVKSLRGEDGARHPLYDLYRREGDDLGRPVHSGLTARQLLEAAGRLG